MTNGKALKQFQHLKKQLKTGTQSMEQIFHGVTAQQLKYQDGSGETILHYLCQIGHFAAAVYLLNHHHADLDLEALAKTKDAGLSHATPLHYACFFGHAALAELLLESGANPAALSNEGFTPFDCAASKHHTAVTNVIHRFLAQQNDNNVVSDAKDLSDAHVEEIEDLTAIWGNFGGDVVSIKPLWAVSSMHIGESDPDEDKDIADHDEHGLPPGAIEMLAEAMGPYRKGTQFHTAVRSSAHEYLRALIQHSISAIQSASFPPHSLFAKDINNPINLDDGEGKTALHWACELNDTDAVEILLAHPKIDINLEDSYGLTAIHYAIRNCNTEILSLLHAKVAANKKIQASGRKRLTHQYATDTIIKEHFCDQPMAELFAESLASDAMKDIAIPPGADDPCEGMTYLHEAVYSDEPAVLIEILKFVDLDLEVRDDHEQKRALSLAKAEAQKGTTRQQRQQLSRFKNYISANLRRINLEEMKQGLSLYSRNDLQKLLDLADIQFQGKSLLEGYINFNVYISVTKSEEKMQADLAKKATKPITAKQVVTAIKEVIAKKSANTTVNDLINPKVFMYMVLQASHAISEGTNVSSGEELDHEREAELAVKRKQKWLEQLSQATDKTAPLEKTFVPIFRGINFMRDFFEPKDRLQYENHAYKRPYFASHGCYFLLGKEPHDYDVQPEELEEKAAEIEEKVRSLDDPATAELFRDCVEARRGCDTLLDRLRIVYTEDISGFNFDVFDNIAHATADFKKKVEETFPWVSHVFKRNPFVSGSVIPPHSVRYALGLSRADANTELLLDPRYDFHGKPKYPCIGMVFIALYPKEAYEAMHSIYIPKAYADGKFFLQKLLELLAEAEVTLTGMLRHVTVAMPIIFPSFEDVSQAETQAVFGLSKKKYTNIAKGVKHKRESIDYRKAINKLKNHLVQYYDKQLLAIASNNAAKQEGTLAFELPTGEFTAKPPTPAEIRKIALLASPITSQKYKDKLIHDVQKALNKLIKINASQAKIEAKKHYLATLKSITTLTNPALREEKKASQGSKKRRKEQTFEQEVKKIKRTEILPSKTHNKTPPVILKSTKEVHPDKPWAPSVLNVSGFGNNCGLFALVLGMKKSLEQRKQLASSYPRLGFLMQINAKSLQSCSKETPAIGRQLRQALGRALEDNQDFKQKRLEHFLVGAVKHLQQQPLPLEMEGLWQANSLGLKNLRTAWNKIEPHCTTDQNIANILKRFQSFDPSAYVDAFYSKLLTHLANNIHDKTSSHLMSKELFDSFYQASQLKEKDYLVWFKILFSYAWGNITKDDAPQKVREVFNEAMQTFLYQKYVDYLHKDPQNFSHSLSVFALLGSISFDIKNKTLTLTNQDIYQQEVRYIFAQHYLGTRGNWNSFYKNYCDYLSNPANNAMLSADELSCLAQYWDVQLDINFANGQIHKNYQQYNPQKIHVTLINPTSIHWQIRLSDQSSHSTEHQAPRPQSNTATPAARF